MLIFFLEEATTFDAFWSDYGGKKNTVVPFRDPFFFQKGPNLKESRMGSQLEVQIGSIGQPRR